MFSPTFADLFEKNFNAFKNNFTELEPVSASNKDFYVSSTYAFYNFYYLLPKSEDIINTR